MMTVTPTQCTANDLWMRETLAKAERYRRLTRTESVGGRQEPLLNRVIQLLRRLIRVHQPKQVRQLQQVG